MDWILVTLSISLYIMLLGTIYFESHFVLEIKIKFSGTSILIRIRHIFVKSEVRIKMHRQTQLCCAEFLYLKHKLNYEEEKNSICHGNFNPDYTFLSWASRSSFNFHAFNSCL